MAADLALKAAFWGSVSAIAWTHAAYPLAAAAVARLRPKRVRKGDQAPTVSVIVAAHDEENVIERRLRNLLELDYPADRVEIVVASDESGDRTDEIVRSIAEHEPRVRLLRFPRAGKFPAQQRAVRETDAEILAFSDANALWAPDALSKLVRNFADPEVAYVCGRLSLVEPDGTNREGAYWRYELWLRERESALGSVTGGNGAICAVRRSEYAIERLGNDLGFPFLMVQRGRRAVYEPQAIAYEKPSRHLEDEYRRKVRMFEHCWKAVLEGGMLRGLDPVYFVQIFSHRVLRYGSGVLHLALLGSSAALAGRRPVYGGALAGQLALLGLAAAGRLKLRVPGAALAYYYVLVTSATVVALARYLRSGVPVMWEKAEGTR